MEFARFVGFCGLIAGAASCQEPNPSFVRGTSEAEGSANETAITDTGATTTATTASSESSDGGTTATAETGVVMACGEDDPAPGGECPTECNAGCTPDTCAIDCGDACAAEVVCPEGFACAIGCSGGNCEDKTLRCPSDHACTITCEGKDSCKSATFVCGAGTCQVECVSGPMVCGDSTLECGVRDSRACGSTGSVTPVPLAESTCECTKDC